MIILHTPNVFVAENRERLLKAPELIIQCTYLFSTMTGRYYLTEGPIEELPPDLYTVLCPVTVFLEGVTTRRIVVQFNYSIPGE